MCSRYAPDGMPGNPRSFQPALPRLPPYIGSAKNPSSVLRQSKSKKSFEESEGSGIPSFSSALRTVSCFSDGSWSKGFP
ncbi:hypothetical protein D3C83_106870 [compost metagenome]